MTFKLVVTVLLLLNPAMRAMPLPPDFPAPLPAPLPPATTVPITDPIGTTTTTTIPPTTTTTTEPATTSTTAPTTTSTTEAPRVSAEAVGPWQATLDTPEAQAILYGSRALCIRRVENGDDYGRSTNPNHFGAYQFDYQTWVANGGSPGDWGYASKTEQDYVFVNDVEHYGYSSWAEWDGC